MSMKLLLVFAQNLNLYFEQKRDLAIFPPSVQLFGSSVTSRYKHFWFTTTDAYTERHILLKDFTVYVDVDIMMIMMI